MDVSVLIPTCNRPVQLARCVTEIIAQVRALDQICSVEVLIGQDGVAWEQGSFDWPHVRTIEGPRRGPAANRNRLAVNAKGRLLVFLDDDCMPQPNLLKSFIEADQQASGLAILEGAIRPDRSPKLADEECPVNEHGGVLWSANMALPAEQFRALQGFDEDFPFATMEDMDFFLRAKKRGLRIVWLPGAVVEHPFERRSGVRRHLQHRYSVLTFVRKHPERLVSIRKGCGLVAILRSVKRRVVDRKWIQPISSYKALMEQVSSTLVLRSTLRDPLRITQEINRLGLCLNLRANGDEKTHSLDVSIPG